MRRVRESVDCAVRIPTKGQAAWGIGLEAAMTTRADRLHGLLLGKAQSEAATCPPPDLTDDQLALLRDPELIQLLKGGVNEAASVLYSRYRRLVWSISFKILRDRAEAEDVVQDVFLEVWRRARIFDPSRGSVKMWILQYAYSRSLNRRKYLALRHLNGFGLNGEGNGHGSHFKDSSNGNGFEALTFEERHGMVVRALEFLSPKQRQAIRLIYFEGLLMKEVADQMGETIANVRHFYYRGIKKLRTVIGNPATQPGN